MSNRYSPLYGVPKGGIIKWSGAVADIPGGWALCDGTNGTPDLRNRFIVGAGDTYNPNDTGGSLSHIHNVYGYTGEGYPWAEYMMYAGTSLMIEWNHTHTVDIDSKPADTRPPYYALCYIMRL